MSDLVPLSDLVAALTAAAKKRKSGAFFVTTDAQHSAMITLSAGNVTGVKFRSANGYDAAAALSQVEQLKYQSAAEPTELPGTSDISTQALLEVLSTGTSTEGPAASASGGKGKVDLEALRARYVAAIGPIAGALFDEAVSEVGDAIDTAEGTDRLIRKLADQIDDETEAANFLRDARSEM